MIQQNTFDIMTACSEIERLIVGGASVTSSIVDQAVKKALDTEHALERYRRFSSFDPRCAGKYARLSENFSKAKGKLEGVLRRLSEQKEIIATRMDAGKSTQLRLMGEGNERSASNVSKPRSGYEYISSMEEGVRGQTLEDLTRMHKDMNSLQDIYFSLSEVASSQTSILDSVQERLGQASSSASAAVRELSQASTRIDSWTRIKIYTVTGVASVGLLFWIL